MRFFGMIGPNVKTASSLFSLFTSNGILQGVFLNDTTSVSHLIETDRVKRTRRWGHAFFSHPGVANTAVLSVRDKDYALFERDAPYEIEISYPTLRTVGRVNTCSLCAHSTFEDPFIHSMTYSILHRTVSFLTLDADFNPLHVKTVRTTYLPLVHSYLRHSGTYVFTESPLRIGLSVYLDSRETRIHVVPEVYTFSSAFYLFHYGPFFENATSYTLYAPVYDSLSFDTMNISGKYRRFILDKATKTVLVEKNPVLESYNLDFPVKWRNLTLLRNLNVDHINGFVLCDGLEIVRTYWLNVSVLGEPYIHEDTLYALTAESLMEMDLVSGEMSFLPVSIPGTLGFHSFMKFKYNMSTSNAGSS